MCGLRHRSNDCLTLHKTHYQHLERNDMKRRHFLSVIGGCGVSGLAGCLSTGYHAAASTTGDGEIQRRVSLADQDSMADGGEIRVDVEVLEPTIADAHTARLRVTTTNEGAKRKISIGTDGCELFNRSHGGSDHPRGLWLHAAFITDHIDRKGNRWVADQPSDEPRAYPAYGCLPKEYDAGESVRNEYDVWDDYQVDGYLEPDTYRWEEDVSIWNDPSTAGDADPDTTITWGFSLTVEKPD